jgi:predicted proteasome-type protease
MLALELKSGHAFNLDVRMRAGVDAVCQFQFVLNKSFLLVSN